MVTMAGWLRDDADRASVDLPHPACAQRREDLVRAEPWTGRKCHGCAAKDCTGLPMSAAGDLVQKPADGAAEFFGRFFLGEMADAGQDDQASAGKVGREAESLLGRQQAVLLSPEDERRSPDPLEKVLVAAVARADRLESRAARAGDRDRGPPVVDRFGSDAVGARVQPLAQSELHHRAREE